MYKIDFDQFGTGPKYSYSKHTDVGMYDIQPCVTPAGKHRGYMVSFANERGVSMDGCIGLWSRLREDGMMVNTGGSNGTMTLTEARKACNRHYTANLHRCPLKIGQRVGSFSNGSIGVVQVMAGYGGKYNTIYVNFDGAEQVCDRGDLWTVKED
jgi:hypothetical protein